MMATSVVNEINHRINDDMKTAQKNEEKNPMATISVSTTGKTIPSRVVVETSSM